MPMPIVFHLGSGSPFAWRVWLSLEHKGLPYETKLLSFDAGENKAPAYLALNPRGRVPAIVDGDFVLYESAAIVEYLDQAYPDVGPPLFPRAPRDAAKVRRLVCEADSYVQPSMEALVEQVLFRKEGERDAAAIAKAEERLATEIARWTPAAAWLAGDRPTAADYTLYPMLALLRRMETRFGGFAVLERSVGAALAAWMKRVEGLSYFDATYPPHWRARA